MVKSKRLRAEAVARRNGAVAWGRAGADVRLAKAVERARPASVRPQLARAELLDKATRTRFEEELDAALKRRPANENKLAGAIRAVAALSPALRASLGEVTAVLLRRGARQRELYACGLRSLAEAQDRQSVTLLRDALSNDEAGGSAALSAACFSRDPELSALLAKVAASRQSHVAFGAELARVARGESNGGLLAQLAPMIKESHRISMCVELFVPLARARPMSHNVGPALAVLRGAERHLGRWLVLAEVAVKAGDLTPLQEAKTRAESGPASSRAAWSLVAWALSETDASTRGSAAPAPPATRPTLELIARLSDRPSADRDTTFLFRMARATATSARPMLETLVRSLPLGDETSLRAALYLARDRAREDMRRALGEAAEGCKREELRGMAVAALWDGVPDSSDDATKARAKARDLAADLLTSRVVGNMAWGALVRAGSRAGSKGGTDEVLTEAPFRWIQWGWLE
ncbi:MAG TPA: hypothetical protein VKU41_22135 [Polyangiaceae bacterium]|nr:hypothetical protein [Polyangiaceae bacterium]